MKRPKDKRFLRQWSLREYFRRIRVGKKLSMILFIQISVLIVLYMIVILVSTTESMHQLDNSIYQVNYTVLGDVKNKIEVIDTVTKFPVMRNYTGGNHALFKYLRNHNGDAKNASNIKSAFAPLATENMMQFPWLNSIYLFDTQGTSLTIKSASVDLYTVINCGEREWFHHALGSSGSLYLLSRADVAETSLYPNVSGLYGARAIIDIQGLNPIGLILASINIGDVEYSFTRHRLFPTQMVAVYSENGDKLFGSKSIELPKVELLRAAVNTNHRFTLPKDSEKYTYHITYDADSRIYSVIQTPYRVIRSALPLSNYFLWGIVLLIILFSIIIFVLIQYSIKNPLVKLVAACTQIGSGDFSTRIEDTGNDELGYVTHSFNKMSEQVETLIQEVYVRDIAERDLELQMLRSQINPHFLYNTLERISMTAYTKGNPDVAHMSQLLANVLRYGVSLPNNIVTVGEEIEHLQEYLQLQKYYFGDKITLSMNIDSSILPLRIIKLILQPLVENALNHGIVAMDGTGSIDIWGYCQNDRIILNVSDNGVGIEADRLKSLQGYVLGENDDFISIGLRNVQRRIQLYYGEEYGIAIESMLGKGTSITLTLPIMEIDRQGGPG